MSVERVNDDNGTLMPPEQLMGSEPSFEEFAATMPEDATGFLIDDTLPPATPADEGAAAALLDGGGEPSPAERRTKRVKMSRKMQKSMDKLKTKMASLPVAWFDSQAGVHSEWRLDDEERDLLTDSIETVFEVLDIEFQIEPLTLTFTSIWWILSYPLLAFGFLFLSKKSLVMEREQKEQQAP